MSNFDRSNPPTSFGAFKPVGNIVAVFDDSLSAMNAQTDLLTGGQPAEDITFMQAGEFIQLLDDLKSDTKLVAMLGSELRKTDQFREHAEAGACFLIVNAPKEEDTKRVMTVVERYDYRFALKYGSLLIERFDPENPASASVAQ